MNACNWRADRENGAGKALTWRRGCARRPRRPRDLEVVVALASLRPRHGTQVRGRRLLLGLAFRFGWSSRAVHADGVCGGKASRASYSLGLVTSPLTQSIRRRQ